MLKIKSLDHLVLTVANIEAACQFYQQALGMKVISFGAGRKALQFGQQKINLHLSGQEIKPNARQATPGSADLCFLTDTPLDAVTAHLDELNIPIELGPVPRTGAVGNLLSLYLRDPDGNLLEISNLLEVTSD